MIQTIQGASRYYRVTKDTVANPGWPFLELGPAGTSTSVSTLMVQFSPSLDFDGQFVVEARMLGQSAKDKDIPFGPVPYRRIQLANVAQDYAIATLPISTAGIIQIPANGLSVVLQMTAPTAGFCDICTWDLQGSSAV